MLRIAVVTVGWAAPMFLFLAGVMFGYYIMSPVMISFLANYQISDMIVNEFDITSYVGTIVGVVFGSGVLFQLPVPQRAVHARRIRFSYPQGSLDRHFVEGDLVMSHVVAVLSATFPPGEDFFVQAVNLQLKHAKMTAFGSTRFFTEAGRAFCLYVVLGDRGQRIRDVRQGPDGALYVVTDEENGQLWRISPR